MSIMDKSIASRIALLLGLFCLVLCAFLISLLQLLKMLSEEADETVNVALPNMAIASYISKESEWAKGILHDSILCRDRFVHLGVVQEIEARRFPENVLESLEALAVEPGVKEKIKNNLDELNGILAGTNRAVAQRIDNLRNTERLVKRIRTLNADLPQLERELYASGMKPGDPGFNVWKTAYSDVLTAMLLLSMHHDRPYSLRLKSEIRTDVKRLLRSAEASPFSGRLKKLSSDAATMALAEDGLLSLYEEYTALESALDALKITHQYTSNSLIESANAVSQQSWTSIQASKKTLAERYAIIVATVGVTFFLAVFLALFIYRSIVRNVVDPIKRLNNCMLDRVNRIPTPFPESVRYELAEMTSSVRYFTSEIEKHEQELLHSHENLENQVAERTYELKALSEKLLMAQESERFKLASELHDNIGATLGAIKFGMERSLRSVRSLPEHELQPDICDTLSTSVSLVKKLATHLIYYPNELRPPQLELGLEATIADFCEEYERVFAHMPIELSIALDEEKLPPNLPIVIFRIIQEALSNIVKHSGATRASVSLGMDGDALRLAIQQDRHGEQRNTEQPWHLPHDSFDGKSELCHIALKESITHPRNTEDGDNSLHPGREYRTLRCFDSIRLGYYKDDSGCRQHYDLDNGGHTERDDFSIDEETGTHTFKRSEKDDKSSCQYKDEYGKHGGTFVLDIFNLYLLVIEKTFFQAFLIFGILYQFLADFHGE